MNGTLLAMCNTFVRPNIPLKVEDTPCSFINKTMCATEGAGAVSVDSGLLDVSSIFELNVPSKDRVQLQRQTACTILPIDGYWEVINLTDAPAYLQPNRDLFGNEQVVVVYHGPDLGFVQFVGMMTFEYGLLTSNVSTGPSV
jgi:hypothetical protein